MGSLCLNWTSSAFTASVTNSSDSAASKARFVCADTFAADARRSKAFFEFALDEPADAATAVDSSDSQNSGTYGGSNAKDVEAPTACPNDRGGAYRLDGSSSRVTTGTLLPPITGSFSEEVWFKTLSPGKLLGFESTVDGTSDHYDKHLYVGASGHLVFGTWNNAAQTVTSPGTVNDGFWHHVVGTMSSDGMVLYLDGQAVASNSSYTTAEWFSGYWRIGQGRLDGWPDQPGTNWFTGSLRFAAAYPFVLSPREVAAEASIGAPGARPDPTPSPSASASTASSATPSASVSSDPAPSASASATASDSPSTAASVTPVRGAHPSAGTIEPAPTSDQTQDTASAQQDVIVASQG